MEDDKIKSKNKSTTLKALETGCQPGTYIFREDSPLVIKEPVPVKINGLITSVRKWIEKRRSTLELLKCHIIVDRANMKISFEQDENNHYTNKISGSLKLNPDMTKFGINNDKHYTTEELANFIKMNRHFFEKPEIAMKLVSDLKNFEAKVNTILESKNNDRGSVRNLQEQTVNSNIPESFKLNIQVFLGMPKEKIAVEIIINANNFNCSLLSPDLCDLINRVRDNIIDQELKPLEKEFTIIEI